MESLRARMRSSLLWITGSTAATSLLQFVATLVLARLLAPRDYGVMAMVMAVQGLLVPLCTPGISSAIIVEPAPSPAFLSTAFWLALALSASAAALLAGAAPLAALYYEMPELADVCRVVALLFLLDAITVVPQSLLRKELSFKAISRIAIGSSVAALPVAIGMAFSGYGVWSLVAQSIVEKVLSTSLLLAVSPWRPQLMFARADAARLFRFGALVTGGELAQGLYDQGYKLIVGKMMGADALGLFVRALNVARLPAQFVLGGAAQLMLPALSEMQGDRARVKATCLRAATVAAVLLVPAMFGMAVLSDVIIGTLYGPAWLAAAPDLSILSWAVLLGIWVTPLTWLYRPMGRPDMMLSVTLGVGVVVSICVLSFSTLGLDRGAAYGYLLGHVLVVGPMTLSAGSLVGIRLRDMTEVVIGPLGLSAVMAAIVLLSKTWLHPHGLSAVWQLACLSSLGAAVYGAGALVFKLKGGQEILRLMRR